MTDLGKATERFDVAIVGMAGRFPGASTLQQFWNNLVDGVESIRLFSDDELKSRGVNADQLSDPSFVKTGAVLDGIKQFASPFFGYTPHEAELMDPQHRVFLESAWEALEDAGYAPRHLKTIVGVFAASSLSTYLLFNLLGNPAIHQQDDAFQMMIGTDKDFLATRVSYKLNLKGPSITVQTGCSSSLVAVCLATQSLLTLQCDMAIAGGVSISVPQRIGYYYQPGGIASPDGHCRPFSSSAAGTVFGDGVGVVILKRLEDALDDHDHIYAVIRGTAVNNDGSAKVGYTAPSVEGQQEVIQRAHALAGIRAEEIGYVEAHGTGTALGDPVEVLALTQAFRKNTEKRGFCALGSVKSNFGHLDAAAGIAGLIKTALMLKYRKIVPSLHYDQPNPRIDFVNSPFFVNAQLREWETNTHARCAGVSSFGIGGTNAHVILEEAPPIAPSCSGRSLQVLAISADSAPALDNATKNLSGFLRVNLAEDLGDIAYTQQVGREVFRYRRTLVCDDIATAARDLELLDKASVQTAYVELRNRPVAFMFPGGGTQFPGMGQELYLRERTFRETFDRCTEFLLPLLGRDMRPVVHPSASEAEGAAAALERPSLGLPAIFTTEYAIAQLFRSWGIEPKCMIGHSLGEYVAGCLAGVFSLPDALALVALRGKLLESLPAGAMLSIYLSEADVLALGLEGCSIAAVNGPENCVVSGGIDRIEKITAVLEKKGIEFRRLHINAAAHSSMVDSIAKELHSFLEGVQLNVPRIPFVSNLTGTWITPDEAVDAHYWTRHLRRTVRFADGISELLKQPAIVLLELGPGRTLSALARTQAVPVISSMRHPHETVSDARVLYGSLARLWLSGVDVDWTALHIGEQRRRLSLPTYPFERRLHWIEPCARAHTNAQRSKDKKANIADWGYLPSWKPALRAGPLKPNQHDQNALWLILADRSDAAGKLAELLRRLGLHVALAHHGDNFRKITANSYMGDFSSAQDLQDILGSISAASATRLKVVHLWNLGVSEARNTDDLQRTGIFSVLATAQALGQCPVDTHLLVVSDGVAQVTGTEAALPEKNMLQPTLTVVAQELNHVQCKLMDLELGPGETADDAVSQIARECDFELGERFVAYRNGQRWMQVFEPVLLRDSSKISIRDGGVYLLVGGLGKVGLTIAQAFAASARCKLVFTGRSEVLDKSLWHKGPSKGTEDYKIDVLRSIERSGSEVAVYNADIADEAQMLSVINAVEQQSGPLAGVIHLAGITGDAALHLVSDLDEQECQSQFRAKVDGCYALKKVLAGRNLDFCVLFSSNASVLGGIGMLAYAAANSFMDLFAVRATESGQRWISINWDGWLTSGVTSVSGSGKTALDRYAMQAEEGVAALYRVLAGEINGHIIVSTGDLQLRIKEWTCKESTPLDSSQRKGGEPRPESISEYVAPRTVLEKQLAAVWAGVLGIDRVGLHDNLFDLGGNSLIGLRIVAQLRRSLGIEVPVTALFEGPTVERLAKLISSKTPEPEAYREQSKRGELRRKRSKEAAPELPTPTCVTNVSVLVQASPVGSTTPEREPRKNFESYDPSCVAIIGMSGAFPGASTTTELWERLSRGEELISFLAPKNSNGSKPVQPKLIPAVATMEGYDRFDAGFFGMTPKEAELTDPQHRILLEHAWNAVEAAGYDVRGFEGSVGVYAGATINTYLLYNLASRPDVMNSVDPLQLNVAGGSDFLTTRISYKLSLTGPSHTIQSACSTSLVSVHCACRSLLNHECDMALAGGVSVNVSLMEGYRYSEGGIVSPDGHCRVFDKNAEGTIFGSGVGLVVLKRLEDAIADGDCIHAVIKGSAVNNDGATKAGYTAPSVEGQAQVIVEALGASDVAPTTISYVECHGTATILGDPVEVRALTKAYRAKTQKSNYCALGSVKSNLGHLDAAAGVTGLIKVVLCMKHRKLVPSLHFQEPNPQIEFSGSPFYVNTELREWKAEAGERLRAGVSAFGVGGTNAHVIVEEAPERGESGPSREWQLLVWSGREEAALDEARKNLGEYLRESGEKLEDIAYTLKVGRQRFAWRSALVCRGREEAREALEKGLADSYEEEGGEESGGAVFVFPGQGAQYVGMGSELYEREEVYRKEMDRCAELLREELGGVDVREVLGGGVREEELQETWLAQPALFAVEYAVARQWRSWGVKPEAMLGHSVGEYVAASLSGVLKVEDALRLVVKRARLMQEMPRGAMLAVEMGEEEAGRWVKEGLWLTGVNEEKMCTLGGEAEKVAKLEEELREKGYGVQRLRTSHAFHTGMMDGMVERYVEEVRKIELGKVGVPYISCVTGDWARDEEVSKAEYWGRQLREPVQYGRGFEELVRGGRGIVVEVGPGQGLKRLAQRRGGRERIWSSLGSRKEGEQAAMLKTLACLWTAGAEIDWKGFYAGEKRHRVPLPTYPFQRQRYWIDAQIQAMGVAAGAAEKSREPISLPSVHSKRLTDGNRPRLRNTYVAPQKREETMIVDILEAALGIHPIGVTDQYGELGGDSLKAATIIGQINSRLSCHIRVVDLYEGLTIRDLCRLISSEVHSVVSEAESDETEKAAELRRNYLQERRMQIQVRDL